MPPKDALAAVVEALVKAGHPVYDARTGAASALTMAEDLGLVTCGHDNTWHRIEKPGHRTLSLPRTALAYGPAGAAYGPKWNVS